MLNCPTAIQLHRPAPLLTLACRPASLILTGNAYAARKNSEDKSWQEAAYTDEIAHLTTPNGK